MIDFIVKLEGALINSGLEYGLKYLPKKKAYVLEIDDTAAYILSVKEENDE